MAGRAASLAVTAGVGALATMAGLYLAKKVKTLFGEKPRMRLFHDQWNVSTRCAWLITELGAESEFHLHHDGEDDDTEMPSYPPAPPEEEDCSPGQGLLPLSPATLPDGLGQLATPGIDDKTFQILEYRTRARDDEEDSLLDYDMMMSSETLPALIVNDEFTMIEGAAICMYLADSYGQFLPEPEHRAEYYSWIMYSAATFDNIMKTLQNQMVDTPVNRRNYDLLEPALRAFDAFARALSDTLETQNYLCGDRFTAADCVMGFSLWWAYTINQGALLDDHPTLQRYLHRLRERPAFQKTFGEAKGWDWSRHLPARCITAIKQRTFRPIE